MKLNQFKLIKIFISLIFILFILNFNSVCALLPHAVVGYVLNSCDGTSPDGATVKAWIQGRENEVLYDIIGPSGNSGVSHFYYIDVGNFQTDWQPGDVLVIDICKGATKAILDIKVVQDVQQVNFFLTEKAMAGWLFEPLNREIITFPVLCEYTARTSVVLTTSGVDQAPTVALSCPSATPHCGNGICEPEFGETPETCPVDCHCGNGICEPELGEDRETCPADCINQEPSFSYDPKDLDITIYSYNLSETLTFSVNAFDPDNDSLVVTWKVDGAIVKQEQSEISIDSKFNFKPNEFKDYLISAEVSDGYSVKQVSWQLHVLFEDCVDEWSCSEWSDCIGSRRIRECYKINDWCAHNEHKPATSMYDPTCEPGISATLARKKCKPNWSCGNWSECKAYTSLQLFSESLAFFKGEKTRVCRDINNCTAQQLIEKADCIEWVEVETRKARWCYELITEVVDKKTGKVLARIRPPQLEKGMGLSISLEQSKYCWFCFDGVKDYDETGVDCGGSCKPCKEKIKPVKVKIERVTWFDPRLILLYAVAFILIYLIFRLAKEHVRISEIEKLIKS